MKLRNTHGDEYIFARIILFSKKVAVFKYWINGWLSFNSPLPGIEWNRGDFYEISFNVG
jgi:hypothetical protein